MIKREHFFLVRFLVFVFAVNALWPGIVASAGISNTSTLLICSSFGYEYVTVDGNGKASGDTGEKLNSPCPFCTSVDKYSYNSPLLISSEFIIDHYVAIYADSIVLLSKQLYQQPYISRAPPYKTFS